MIKIAIIGCGHWGPNFIRNFNQLPGAEVKAICDLSSDKLKSLKAAYPDVLTYSDYNEILGDSDLDAVVVATPAFSHYKITKQALECGKHVLVEKPLALKLAAARELIDISKNLGKTLMVGHTFLYNPIVNKLKEVIQREELGKIYYIHSRRTNLGPLRKDVSAIWDLSPHDISIMNYLLERMPLEVSAYGQKFLSHDLVDVGFAILKYPNDILSHIHVSWLDPKKIREMTIIGTKKMLVYNDIDSDSPIKIYDKRIMKESYDQEYSTFEEFQLIIKDGEVEIPKVELKEPLKMECQHFIDSINNQNEPLTDGENGLEVLKVIDAINESITKKGEFVKI